MEVPILFADDHMFVINKPAGIVVNRSESTRGETIQDWAQTHVTLSNLQNDHDREEFLARSGIVHRLDKDTTGVLVIAKTPEAFRSIKSQFATRSVKKNYHAIVHGRLPADGEVRAPIARLPWNRMRFGVIPGGREAVTRFRSLSYHTIPDLPDEVTYVEVFPETGRTHQIRVHMKYLNHPILGDRLYAGRKSVARDRQVVDRLMLHAHELTIRHPNTGESLVFTAAIPDDMKRVILGKNA